ncbi:conjugal transfer protein TraW [Escherichia coli]|nr:conjugal transfer protein TraW [Escherichia coli]
MRSRGLNALLIWGQSVVGADLGTWGGRWRVTVPDMLAGCLQPRAA